MISLPIGLPTRRTLPGLQSPRGEARSGMMNAAQENPRPLEKAEGALAFAPPKSGGQAPSPGRASRSSVLDRANRPAVNGYALAGDRARQGRGQQQDERNDIPGLDHTTYGNLLSQ